VLLAIDVGNTRTHIGVFSGDRLILDWHTATNDRATADDLAADISGAAARKGLDVGVEIRAVGIASVVPAVTQVLRSMAQRVFDVRVHVIESASEVGIRVATDDPAETGADRLVNALAARRIADGRDAIVVDAGTATKVDAVSADGRFLGGTIAPGITPAVSALVCRAAALSAMPSGAPISAIGASTLGALRSGVVFGAAGMIDALVARVAAELGGAALVVATGGAAPLVAHHTSQIDIVEPALTLIGIRLATDARPAVAA
jgi:type III pantothenate kinase